MTLEEIKTIGVVGAGTMGQGIAQICAQAGYKTILFDINAQVLEKARQTTVKNLDKGIERGKLTEEEKEAALSNLSYTGNTLQLSCDVIIEAVVERLEVKQNIFQELASINKPDTILASNTSSIPITQIAAAVPNPERVVGMHFFNPAHIMKLVEVISGAATSPETAQTIRELAEKLGKTAVMAKDSPGFIVNRVARHFYVEGLKLLEEGVADVETIDKLMQASGFKMGPFELMDLIGVDTNYSVTTSMFEAFHYDAKFRPSRIQQQKVDAGHHGRKSGKGFYTYEK
ncbi:3-hydroxyacyl-CoA dehydrogenase family protein [Pontibacter litorisediminis]|uniref:3-hydroxyacyl-CoA dehydrogenase family protein n=1 Tax=Pontibacter litorisediminis TaxID=1846260 RepID=UPI0023EC5C42|nr:3-hydroxyacyl-CoA dehydrogenase NAD-binding domain-containing protein [Pontibacter litorisediminis]